MLRLPPIEFKTPNCMEDVLLALADDEVRLVAGGTDLWPNMKRRQQRAKTVVSLMSIAQLRGIEQVNGDLRVGATTTLTDLLRNQELRIRFPALARALASISSPPLRNMGTLGGNLCVDTRCTYYNQSQEWRCAIDYCLKEQGKICWVATGSPKCWAHSASDSAPILCALDAQVKLISSSAERLIPLTELYRDDGIEYLTKQRDEVLAEVMIPSTSDHQHCRSSFWKLRRRGAIDFSVFSVAAALWLDPSGIVTRASMYLGAVNPCPLSVDEINTAVGKPLDEELIASIAHAARLVATPMDNTDFSASWRGKMVEHYTQAALREIAGLPIQRLPPQHGLTVV